jgi:hypothetical protein
LFHHRHEGAGVAGAPKPQYHKREIARSAAIRERRDGSRVFQGNVEF